MPIKQRLAQVAAAKSTSTHGGNEDKLKIEEQSTQPLKNNMSVDTLIDPEDYEAGSTHTSVTAKSKVVADDCSTNVGTLPNDMDPAAGVLTNADADEDEDEDDEEDLEDDDEVDASFEVEGEDTPAGTAPEELTNNNGVTPLEAAEGEDEDWDAPLAEDDDPTINDIDGEEVEGEGAVDELGDDDVVEEVEDKAPEGEELSLLDVDETPDMEVAGLAYASIGTRLVVIKAHRIIATMTKKQALASGRDDVYMSDQFQQVADATIAKAGLRKGLKTMGFALTKVNVSKAAVVNTRVALAVTKTTAAVRKVTASKEQAFQQSLTIAAVGINRRYFNEQPNELKAHLETELQRAGVRGGAKIVQHAFASFGPAYAKTIVELANKISAMPEEVRNGYVAALDLTSEDMDVPEEDVVPVGAEGDNMDGGEEGVGDEFMDDTVTAGLESPGYKTTASTQVQAAAKVGNYSLAASAVLAGERPLFM